MTVGQRVKQTLASLKGVQADFESFALETQNQQAKQMYQQLAEETKRLVNAVEARVRELEQQEPQYRQA